MKIAILVDKFPALSETFVLNQITGLIDRGVDLDVYADTRGEDLSAREEFDKYGLENRTWYFQHGSKGIPTNKVVRLLKVFPLLYEGWKKGELVRLLRAFNLIKYGKRAASLELFYKTMVFSRKSSYDIVHCHFGPNGQVGVALKDIGAIKGKVITTCYGYDISSYIKKNGPKVFEFLFCHGDLFIALSEKMKSDLIRLGCTRDKIVVHRLGVDLSRFKFSTPRKIADTKIRLLTVGRLVEKKGIEYGIRAVAQVVKKYPEIEYKIVGDGELKEEIIQLIDRLHLGEYVQLLGWMGPKEVATLMENADIFLAPSVTARNEDQEGTPTVLIEALASGLPVLSTIHSGIPEIVRDGESGFLVAERNVSALAERLEHLVRHPERWEEMGRAGREWIQEYHDIERLNNQLTGLFEKVLDK